MAPLRTKKGTLLTKKVIEELTDEAEGDVAVPEVGEAGGVAWPGGVKVLADLAGECGAFALGSHKM